jgi:hypothetical protein
MINKKDLVFILTPFLLTAVFIVIGYNILIQSTPEARINPKFDETFVEIIDSGDIEILPPQTEMPADLEGLIVAVPQNQTTLQETIEKVTTNPQHNVVYLALPVKLNDDNTFSLENLEGSNEENLKRWTKTFVSAAHDRKLHVVLAITLNASSTIKDPSLFAINYDAFIESWAGLANELSISYLYSGITVGHPLYSEIEDTDMNKILGTVQRSIREKYNGRIGLGYCCTQETNLNMSGTNFINVISTPEFPFIDLQEQIVAKRKKFNIGVVFYYNRDQGVITSSMP